MTIADENIDLLQKIEAVITRVYRAHLEVKDIQVMRALDALTDCYRAEIRGHAPKQYSLPKPETLVFKHVKGTCEIGLGREQPKMKAALPIGVKTTDEIVSCLRQLRKSAERWNKRGGQQGYLNFISHYV
ncbi:MAG: hypothetical protein HC808_01625 [Candidatus Competibacteraceae bacterium]|nr:hypothetical protein [Candidatus Competibacteraceae bacterium]